MVVLGQKHQHAPGDADLRRQARALGAHRVFDHLHHQGLALKHLALYRNQRLRGARRADGLALGRWVPNVGHMQKRRALEPNVNKRRLHARQHPRHLAQIDVAHQAALKRALHVQLLHRAVLHNGHAGFLGRPVDQNVLLHGFDS